MTPAQKARAYNSSVEQETFIANGGMPLEWYRGYNIPGQYAREEARRDAQRKALDSAVTLVFEELGAPTTDDEQRAFDARVDAMFATIRAGGSP